MKQKKQIIHWLSVIVIGIALGLGLQFVRAWTEPTEAPPNGNVGAPLNTGAQVQTKAGGLNIGGKLKVGDDLQPQTAGQIRWTGTDFEGFNGTAWKSFTATGGGSVAGGSCSDSGVPSWPASQCADNFGAYNVNCYSAGDHIAWWNPGGCPAATNIPFHVSACVAGFHLAGGQTGSHWAGGGYYTFIDYDTRCEAD